MKNTMLIAAMAAAFIAGPALAGTVTGAYDTEATTHTVPSREQTVNLNVTDQVFGPVGYVANLETNQGAGTGQVYNMISGGVNFTQKFGPVTVVPQLSYGEHFASRNDFNFYGVEVNAVSKTPVTNVDVVGGIRYQNTFNPSRYENTRYEAGLQYDINTRYAVGVKYDRTSGYLPGDAVGAFVKVNF